MQIADPEALCAWAFLLYHNGRTFIFMNANFTQTNGQIRIRPSIYTPHPADITNVTVAGLRPSDFPEISPTLELLDLSKSVSRKISQLEKKFDNFQRKSSAVLQARNLLIGANNSIFACLDGDDIAIWAMIDEIQHLLHGGNQ